MHWLVKRIFRCFSRRKEAPSPPVSYDVTIETTGSRTEIIKRLTAIHMWCIENGYDLTQSIDKVLAKLDADIANALPKEFPQKYVSLVSITNTTIYGFPTKERAALFKLFNY